MPQSGGTRGTNDHLSRYVRDWLAEHDTSERELARRAVDPRTERVLLHSWINELIQGSQARAPELWRIRALAAAMAVSERVLAELAGAQWLGLEVDDVPDGDGGRVIVTIPEDMSPAERDRFIRIAEDLARNMAN